MAWSCSSHWLEGDQTGAVPGRRVGTGDDGAEQRETSQNYVEPKKRLDFLRQVERRKGLARYLLRKIWIIQINYVPTRETRKPAGKKWPGFANNDRLIHISSRGWNNTNNTPRHRTPQFAKHFQIQKRLWLWTSCHVDISSTVDICFNTQSKTILVWQWENGGRRLGVLPKVIWVSGPAFLFWTQV